MYFTLLSIDSFIISIYCGGYSGEDPPLPIPNREVKLTSADGTATPSGRVGSRRFSETLSERKFRQGLFRYAGYYPSASPCRLRLQNISYGKRFTRFSSFNNLIQSSRNSPSTLKCPTDTCIDTDRGR